MSWLERIAAAAASQKSGRGGGRSWWRWPLLVLLIVIGFAVFSLVEWSRRRELARLRHELFRRKLEERNAVVAAAATAEEDEARRHESIANGAAARAALATANIEKVEERYALDLAAVDRLSWGDLRDGPR